MAVNVETVLCYSIAQDGDRYVFGAEAAKEDVDPDEFDCSELIQWSCARARLSPVMPDGAYNQWMHCKKYSTMLTVTTGMKTRGALLFVGDGTGVGRDAITHVAMSLGDGTTIEARGRKWGVGVFPSVGRFDFAAKIPGAVYRAPAVPTAARPSSRPVIRLGSKGAAVSYLQTVLRKHGFKNLQGRLVEVTGRFDKSTEKCVRDIQAYCQKKVDGIVGPVTWSLIDGLAR